MKQQSHGAYILSVGLAMFSMFFGAGNVVFPLLVGAESEGHIIAALLGLCLTAIGVPFLGLYAMTFFDGEYRPFFERAGLRSGFAIIAILMGLLGPFGALPRCVALSYSTFSTFLPSISAVSFSLVSIIVIYVLSVKKSKVVEILGVWLTPLLLISLAAIVIRGIFFADEMHTEPAYDSLKAFTIGLTSGYHTMDLIGAFFFCHFVVNSLKKISLHNGHIDRSLLAKNTLYASSIGAVLLALVYGGLAYVAAHHNEVLDGVSSDKALGVLAYHFLGSWGGVVTCVAVVLACLTTAIALAAVFAEFLHRDVFFSKISYKASLSLTLAISFFVSILEFQGIFRLLAPIVQVMYPSLIVLSIANILAKSYGIAISTRATFVMVLLTIAAALLS